MTLLLEPALTHRQDAPVSAVDPGTRPADADTGTSSLMPDSPSVRFLRVGLIGFGRTGREVASRLLGDQDVSLEWVVRRTPCPPHQTAQGVLGVASGSPGRLHSSNQTDVHELLDDSPVDVVVDFSSESGLDYYAEAVAARGVPMVSAISHYPDARQRDLQRLARSAPVLWSPNITLGINFLLLAAQSLRRISPEADIQIVEEHFRAKKGVSGTASRLARALGAPEDAVHVVRAGGIIGVHEVLFGFPTQTVRLRHEAISREAFGDGALFAARQIVDREPGLYRMEDLLLPYFSGNEAVAGGEPPRAGGIRTRLASQLRRVARKLD